MSQKITFSIYLFISLYIGWVTVQTPFYNWDMLPYVASAQALSGKSSQEIHQYTYGNLEQATGKGVYAGLTNKNDRYRDAVANSHELLSKQLPYYQIRLVYTAGIFALTKLGLSPYFATHFISALSVVLGVLMFYPVLGKIGVPPWLLLFFPIFLVKCDLLHLARFSTPDGMAFLSMAILFWAMKDHKHLIPYIAPIAVLVRTDLVMFTVPLIIYTFIRRKNGRYSAVISLTASLALYYAVNAYFGNYGWQTVFTLTFVKTILDPTAQDVALNLSTYLSVLSRGLTAASNDDLFVTYLLFSLFSMFAYFIVYHFQKVREMPHMDLFCVHCISVFYACVHFVAFPGSWSRFFVGQYAVAVVICYVMVFSRVKTDKQHENFLGAFFKTILSETVISKLPGIVRFGFVFVFIWMCMTAIWGRGGFTDAYKKAKTGSVKITVSPAGSAGSADNSKKTTQPDAGDQKIVTVDLSQINHLAKVTNETRWNAPGHVVFKEKLIVSVPGGKPADGLHISLDNNDRYKVVINRNLEYVIEKCTHLAKRGGVVSHELTFEQPLTVELVEVEALGGDGLYSLAHIVLKH